MVLARLFLLGFLARALASRALAVVVLQVDMIRVVVIVIVVLLRLPRSMLLGRARTES